MDRDSVVTKDCFEVLSISLIDEEDTGGLSSMWTEQVFLQLIQLKKPFKGEDRERDLWGWTKEAISRVISRLM